MRKKLLSLTLFAVILSSFSVFADSKKTPVEVFIDREKEQQTFMPVNGLWETDNSISHTGIDQMVSGAQLLQVNFGLLTDMIQRPVSAISLSVPSGNGGSYTIELARFDFLSTGFQLYDRHNGAEVPVAYTPGVYYRGVVKGVPGSIAAFSFYSNKVSGVFSLPGVGNFVLGEHTVGTAEQGHYVLYNDMNLKISNKNGGCASDALPTMPDKITANKNGFNSCKDIEVFLNADFDTYSGSGSSTSVVADYIISVYNMVATLYRNEGIYTSIKAITVNTTPDIYNTLSTQFGVSSDDYLFEFGDDVQNNIHGADLAMLVSAINLGLGGIAWRGVLCSGYNGPGNGGPYAFSNITGTWTGGNTMPTFNWDITVLTHELGHNIGSRHTHACAWNGSSQTAIDACAPVEGGCGNPSPKYPAAGGTIMSYCHLVGSVGINLANGFGPQPGQVIRDAVNSSSCAQNYVPNQPVALKAKTVSANRECTDENDVTYYWNDNNNAREEDDLLALKIRKAGNVIGNLDDGTFAVRNSTSLNYSNGNAVKVALPTGTIAHGTNIAANRTWKVTATKQPAGELEVMFPIMKQDITDIDGSVPASVSATQMSLYSVNNMAIDPSPANNLQNAVAADLNIYTNGPSANTKNWSIETKGDTIITHFNTTKLVGGTIFYSYSQDPAFVQNIYQDGQATFFPNPTHNNWNVWMPNSGDNIRMSLYTVDGRVIAEQQMKGGALNEVNATELAAGLYYYRISSETATYTGTLQKK